MKAFSFVSRELGDQKDAAMFDLRGYIDAHTVIEFERAVNASIDGGVKSLVLDLSGLSYISSAGIGAMMGLARKLSQRGGDLVLLSPTQKVFAILEGLGFTKIFKIASSETEALEKLNIKVS
ncbi:MAG: STAS domain-containing protein [Candidatus Sumerlaeaceae bacterium]|jgi:anti-anti-sigma factor|nr:STAS domain-containing protein [Candidatus Sumerlaeaceae bacterium]